MNLKISDQKSVSVSKDMYGLFFEDINYSLAGGLYAEMLENRNFESVFAYGKKDDFHTVFDLCLLNPDHKHFSWQEFLHRNQFA